MSFNQDQPRAPAGTSDGGKWVASATSKIAKLTAVKPETMTGGSINKEIKQLRELSSKVTNAFIEAGRGSERPTDRKGKTDPLSKLDEALSSRQFWLTHEVQQRAGPGYYDLPHGVGRSPRSKR